ncbi:cytochrome c-type biogenesis protein CcmH [Aeromonas sp. RU39B]|uniref:cytochrome c-type biogenesis protein n=1 Tax=Aeromonas sp. RU39B TaxID=1907416 RepID=UPI0009567661|nr:cytochrome c-type biogenesis protein CcmH [Aeromonas sp. RU39B]
MTKLLPLLACVWMLFSLPVRADIDVYQFDNDNQEQVFRELTRELRCPKCQNQDIADSNAGLAKDLRDKTYQMLRAGKSKQDVIDYMVARYGNFILYDPPLMASTLILWLAPLGAIVLGMLFIVLRSRKTAVVSAELTEQERQRLARLLDEEQRS